MFHESGVVPPRRAPTARGRSHHDDHRATRHIDRRVVWRSPGRQELESDQRILLSGRVLSVDQHYLGSWHVGCVRVWKAQPVNVLILDEQLELADQIRQLARQHGWQPHFVGSLPELELALATQGRPAFVLINQHAPLTAWELEQRLPGLTGDAPFVVLSEPGGPGGLGDLPGVVCLERPLRMAETERRLAQVLADLGLGSRRGARHGIIGQSKQLDEMLARLEKVAPSEANVCISGESGTGKELLAHAIHNLSPRADRPFVILDCTAIPETLMESHLFGHVRGSFTGAVEHRTGFFSLAHTGTLFIDEISELSLPMQAKLLRAIQMREFVKVGDSRPTRTDIRLITASNKDLRRMMQTGAFREDLYFRIAAVHGKAVPRLLPRALELMEAYDWPGNVRQLENCLEQAVVLCEEDCIDVDLLSL